MPPRSLFTASVRVRAHLAGISPCIMLPAWRLSAPRTRFVASNPRSVTDGESEFGEVAPHSGHSQESHPRRVLCAQSPGQSSSRWVNIESLCSGLDE